MTSHRPTRLAPTMLVALAVAPTPACVQTRPRTELVVELDAEPGVAMRAAAVRVRVRGGRDVASLSDRFDSVLNRDGGAGIAFPVRFTVVPLGDDPRRLYEIDVSARDDESVLIGQQRLRGTYLQGRTTFVRLVLEDCCIEVAPRCSPTQTCRACVCEEVVLFDPRFDGGVPPDAPTRDATGGDGP
ncbi:MAG: hypothetical protein NZ898_16755, partial [Myxococcota bacterium]|nr:hypothetical protein [Myxococcota bacterium]